MKKGIYRCVKYWQSFFHHDAYRIEKFVTFLWWSWWVPIEDNSLANRVGDMLKNYGLEWEDILDEKEI